MWFKNTLLFSFLFAWALTPLSTLAADINYARVVEHSDTEVLIKQTTLTEESWQRCSIQALTCSPASETTKVATADPAPAFMNAYRALLPAGASSLHRSPDGRYIAFYIPATQSRKTRTFGVMDTTDLSVYTKVEAVAYWDLLSEALLRYYSFSPDSKTLVYLDDVKDAPTPYKVDLTKLGSAGNTLPSERLFSKEYSVVDVVWKDADTIYYIANRENPYAWALYELNITTYALKKIADNVSYADTLWIKGNKLMFAQNDANGLQPALLNMTTGAIEYFDIPVKASLTTQGKVVTSLKEGLSGVFLLEANKNSNTLVVWLHGGPYRQVAEEYHPYTSYGGYDWLLQKLADNNVGVLKLDYPGSAGFGRLFAESITGGVGTEDARKSAVAIKDFTTRNGYTNVYVMGNSYGGYLSLKLLVDNPTLFKGAFSINGVADWLTLLTQLDSSIFNVQFHGTVDDTNRDLYQKASIYNYVDTLTNQKVVLMHGGSDKTISYKQSEGLATFLTLNNKSVQYVKLEGEDHVYKKPESFETLCSTALTFVGRGNSMLCDL